MRNCKSKILLGSFLLLANFSYSFNNLIHNPGFEDASSGVVPTREGQIKSAYAMTGAETEGPEVWNSDLDIEAAGSGGSYYNHSPDWYDINSTLVNTRATSSNGGARNGIRYAGMHDYELLEQAFFNAGIPSSGEAYVFEAYIQLSEYGPNLMAAPFQNTGSILKVYLAKTGISYDSDSHSDNCTTDYCTHNNGPTQSIREVVSLPINSTLYPLGGGWYKIQAIFTSPQGYNALGIPTNSYDWISIELVNESFSNSGGQVCQKTYMLIDDVGLYRYCEYECAPHLGPIRFSSWESAMDGTIQSSCVSGFVACGIDGIYYHPYHLYIENILGMNFTVFNRAGSEVAHSSSFSYSGLNYSSAHPNFLFVWTGGDDNGISLINGEVYDYILHFWNCDDSQTWIASFTYWYCNDPNYPYNHNVFEIHDYTVPSCCTHDKYIQNTTINVDKRYDSDNFIIAGKNVTTGTQGEVTLGMGNEVRFFARDYIELNPGFNTTGAISNSGKPKLFYADIASCGYGQKNSSPPPRLAFDETIDTWENRVEDAIMAFPNPSTGKFYLKFKTLSDGASILKVEVATFLGKIVTTIEKPLFISKNSIEVDMDQYGLASGAYIVKAYTSDNIYTKYVLINRATK